MWDAIRAAVENLLAAAVEDAMFLTITHEGEPARYVAYNPGCGCTFGTLVRPGDVVRINREHRLVIEPLTQVSIRPLRQLSENWRTA